MLAGVGDELVSQAHCTAALTALALWATEAGRQHTLLITQSVTIYDKNIRNIQYSNKTVKITVQKVFRVLQSTQQAKEVDLLRWSYT